MRNYAERIIFALASIFRRPQQGYWLVSESNKYCIALTVGYVLTQCFACRHGDQYAIIELVEHLPAKFINRLAKFRSTWRSIIYLPRVCSDSKLRFSISEDKKCRLSKWAANHKAPCTIASLAMSRGFTCEKRAVVNTGSAMLKTTFESGRQYRGWCAHDYLGYSLLNGSGAGAVGDCWNACSIFVTLGSALNHFTFTEGVKSRFGCNPTALSGQHTCACSKSLCCRGLHKSLVW